MNAFIFNGKFMKEKFRDKAVLIAMEGDNNSGVITFEFDRFYPDRRGVDLSAYTWQLLVQGEILPEPHENIITEGTGLAKEVRGSTITIRWTVGGANAYLEGLGDAQFKAVGAGSEVWKSEVFDVKVLRSINADGIAALYPDILTDLSSRVLALEGRMAIAEDEISDAWDELFRLESDKQDKYDATLNTTDKTVPGAINEIKNTADSAKSTADGLDAKATEALSKAEAAESVAAEKYTKPATGIPKSDLSSGVQSSLGKADSAVQTETDPTVPGWAKELDKPEYTAAEIAGLETVNNLTNYYRKTETYTQVEVNNLISAIPKLTITVVTELPAVGDPTKIYVVGNKEYLWLAGEERYEQFGDLSVDLSNYYTKTEVDEAFSGLALVATSGDYGDLSGKPSIASQAEAETGTDNAKMMTALRVKQAIDTLAPEYTLPTATDAVLGGVKVGAGLSINEGVLSADGGGGGIISSVEVLGDWS